MHGTQLRPRGSEVCCLTALSSGLAEAKRPHITTNTRLASTGAIGDLQYQKSSAMS